MAKPGTSASDEGEGPGKAPAKRVVPKQETKALAARVTKFKRGPEIATKRIKDKKLRGQLRHSEKLVEEAAISAAKTEQWLLPEEAGSLQAEGMERTYRFKQEDLVEAVDVTTAQKAFDLQLPELGPYSVDYTSNGKHMVMGGAKGHLAVLEWSTKHLVTELQVKETVRAVTFLHNEKFFAAAQKKYVFIYDKRGLEVHCLREHLEVHAMQFLPHHFLLATVGKPGVLIYQDTSTGQTVAECKTKLGRCATMAQNPNNGTLNLGHANGVVTVWSPNMSQPLARLLSHRGPVTAAAVDGEGRYLVTAGLDCQCRVWDVRTFKPVHSYFTAAPAVSLDVSQRGLLAVAYSGRVQIWKDAMREKQQSPFMTHSLPPGSKAQSVAFCPYEDVLGVGHSGGMASLLVPGAGEPNFDSFVANPFISAKQRREQEVHQLLDKLPPETIMLNPDAIGVIKSDPKEVQREKRLEQMEAELAARRQKRDKNEDKTKMKGKNKQSKRHRKKQQNVVDDKKYKILMDEKRRRDAAKNAGQGDVPDDAPVALRRFYKSR
mmetsp:Transcript_37780/g.70924  ORF Transcript_37780/g.70924 Transcript_37780/m.70924 type:complete len:546 (-) Transcript_37780:283-1920(-)|eukprot:CAMPEP_0114308136 /NCGR_PEP_ID=MMETSP0059-20121206/17884_1 /TAXON_ID=36894 /ORGANISM="Pyramimonas parkeae, Strain CCMP726" /LENGTH=545 /DNA_ID=CAMNT_0001431731 /DNA_START=70 /DNA_END=1710 /DNA_ORIENTATION=+